MFARVSVMLLMKLQGLMMAEITKKVTVPASERTVVVETVCDLCGVVGKGDGPWADSRWEVEEVTISYNSGHNWGQDGASYEVEEFDVCPACWENKIKPMFEKKGVDPRIRNVDY